MKSLAYCVDAVLDAAEEEKEAAAGAGPVAGAASHRAPDASFSPEELRRYFARNIERLARAADELKPRQPELAARVAQICSKLRDLLPLLDSPAQIDLEDLERRLSILEEKLGASLASLASEQVLLEIRRDLDRQLAAYRRKMTADQLSTLERRYTQKRIFEAFAIPRLSLFYLT